MAGFFKRNILDKAMILGCGNMYCNYNLYRICGGLRGKAAGSAEASYTGKLGQ